MSTLLESSDITPGRAERVSPSEPGTPRPGRWRRARRTALRNVVPPLAVLAAVIGLWLLVSYVVLAPSRRFLLPPPQQVLQVGILRWQNLHKILSAAALTGRAALVGFAIAVVLGTALAVLMSQAKWIERSLFPYAVILQTIPILALVPLIGFSLGFNFRSRVLIVVIISIFPIVTNTLFGILSVEKGLHDLFNLQKVSRFTRLWRLQLPAALPAFFTGLRISAGLAVIGAIVGDFFFVQGAPGIGELINLYSTQLAPEQLYAAVIVSSLMGILAFTLVGVVQRRVVGRWHESALRPEDR
jgi:NitT/TauT family transport system permease protein